MVNNASPLELTIINYKLLLGRIDEAISANAKSDNLAVALQKARDCVGVLYETLDMGVEFSYDLADLYMYINGALIRAGFLRDNDEKNEALNHAKNIAAELMSAWENITEDEKTSQPQGNVYAGLTYGADGQLTEFEDFDPDGGYKI